MGKRMPTVFLYSIKAHGNDPEKELFTSERPIEGLEKPAAEEVLETDERLEKREKPWFWEHEAFSGCHDRQRPTDKTWNAHIDTVGLGKDVGEGWKGNPDYGPEYSKPMERHPRELGEIILALCNKPPRTLPRPYQGDLGLENVFKSFRRGRGGMVL